MLIIGARVIEGMSKARTWVDQNLETEVRVNYTRDKLCVGVVKNLSTLKSIAKIKRGKGITLQTL